MVTYYEALRNKKPAGKVPPGLTVEKAKEAIDAMNKALIGPMSNVERIMLVHDKGDMREWLAILERAL